MTVTEYDVVGAMAVPFKDMPVTRSPSGRVGSYVVRNPFEVPSRRKGRVGTRLPASRCHCCSRTVLICAPVSRMLTSVLAKGWTSAAWR